MLRADGPELSIPKRCSCGTLLGILKGAALHIRYKDFSSVIRGGIVEVRCRRCGRTSLLTLPSDGDAAA